MHRRIVIVALIILVVTITASITWVLMPSAPESGPRSKVSEAVQETRCRPEENLYVNKVGNYSFCFDNMVIFVLPYIQEDNLLAGTPLDPVASFFGRANSTSQVNSGGFGEIRKYSWAGDLSQLVDKFEETSDAPWSRGPRETFSVNGLDGLRVSTPERSTREVLLRWPDGQVLWVSANASYSRTDLWMSFDRIVETIRPIARAVTNTGCGNGAIENLEQCDDGNLANGDGCNRRCDLEPPLVPTILD